MMRKKALLERSVVGVAGLLLAVLCVPQARGDGGGAKKEDAGGAPDTPVSYYRDVAPILRERCQGCHQPARPKGKVILTSYPYVAGKARESEPDEDDEPLVVPGKPEASLLVREITSQDGEPPEMPKDGEPLSKTDVDLIARWIAEGARDDTPPSEKVEYSMEHPPVYHVPPVITSLDFSPDDTLLAITGHNEVILRDGSGKKIVARLVGLSERVEAVKFSPDGKLLAVAGGSPSRLGEVQIWDVARKKLKLSHPVTHDTVYGVSWSGDGKIVAFGCADNSLRAIDASSGKEVLYQGAHGDWVLDTVFSTDSSHLVSVSRDRSMKLIVVKTQQFVDNITSITPGALKGGLMALDRHPSKDELLVGGADGVPKIYRMFRKKARKIGDDFNRIRAFDPMPGRIFSVEFSPDGSLIAAGSSDDMSGEVRVYQVADGKLLWRYPVESGAVYAVTFRGDGAAVAAGGFDGKVHLIDTKTGKLRAEFVAAPLAEKPRVVRQRSL